MARLLLLDHRVLDLAVRAHRRRLQIVGADGTAIIALGALDRGAEQLVDLVGDGLDQIAIAAETRVTDDILDLAADDQDFLGCLALVGHVQFFRSWRPCGTQVEEVASKELNMANKS